MARICIIDDDGMMRSLLRDELEDWGHEVLEAGNGSAGLALVIGTSPDLVIADVNMPKLNGLQLRAMLQEQSPQLAERPFIFLSGFSDDDDIEDALDTGADYFLTKPVDLDQLVGCVDELLAEMTSII